MEGPVITDGAVAVAGDRIVAVGPAAAIRQDWHDNGLGAEEIVFFDHGDGAIIPALVNTHLHLEFTALQGAVPPQANLPAWLQAAIDAFTILHRKKLNEVSRKAWQNCGGSGPSWGPRSATPGGACPYWRPADWSFTIFTNAWGLTCWPRLIGRRFSLPGPEGNCFFAGERRSPCPLFCIGAAVSPDQGLESGAGAADERACGGIPAGKSIFARKAKVLCRNSWHAGGVGMKVSRRPVVHPQSIWTGWTSGMKRLWQCMECGWRTRTGNCWPGGVSGYLFAPGLIFIPALDFRI